MKVARTVLREPGAGNSPGATRRQKMNILKILDKKIEITIRPVDQKIRSQVDDLWKQLSPAQSCPPVSEIMKKINQLTNAALKERGQVIKDTVIETFKDVPNIINKNLIDEVLKIAQKHFPETQYVGYAENTKGVYERRQAPINKFCERVFNLELTAIKCNSANLSRLSSQSLKNNLEEILVKKNLNKKSFLSLFLQWFALPAVKWFLRILSAIIIAIALYILGING